jgi:hypothetical protein
MGFSYNRLTIHATAGFTQSIVDAWNNGDMCLVLSERYAIDMQRTDRSPRERARVRQIRTGSETSYGRPEGHPKVSADSDGTSVTIKVTSIEAPGVLRNMLAELLGSKVTAFTLMCTDPTDKYVYVCNNWSTSQWRVVSNIDWIRSRIPANVVAECNLEAWAEEEEG